MSIIDKVCGKLGLMEEVPEEAQKEKPEPEEARRKAPEEIDFRAKRPAASGPSNVVNLHGGSHAIAMAKQMKVVVVEPFSFDDAQCVADHLKNKKPVVVNFENTDKEAAKRIIDFISGTTYALSGNIQKVGNHIFLCAPSNVDVSFFPSDEADNKVVLPWINK